MKILYTCITNGYDMLRPIKADGWRCICFTDADIKCEGWEIIRLEEPLAPKIHRRIKIEPTRFLPTHSVSVWIDANLSPQVDMNEFVADKQTGYWLMEHPERNCIYEEAAICIELKKDVQEIIQPQMKKYIAEQYPLNNGLVGTGVIVRDTNLDNIYIGINWWKEVEQYSSRDQLSFNYVAWKRNLKYKTFPFLHGFDKKRHN